MHWLIPLALLLGLNIIATAATLRSELYERGQRAGQIVLVWLLPLLGAACVLLFALSQQATTRRGAPGGARNDWENLNAGHADHTD